MDRSTLIRSLAYWILMLIILASLLAGCGVLPKMLASSASEPQFSRQTALQLNAQTGSPLARFDANGDCALSDSEFFNAVDAWIAQSISDEYFFRAVDIWISESSLCEVALTMSDSGQSLNLSLGQMVAITLEANPTTGYVWERADSPGSSILEPVGEPEYRPSSDLIGAGGIVTHRFKATQTGKTDLVLIYHQPWEAGTRPLAQFVLHVSIRR